MAFRISGQNLDVGGALRERVNDRVAEAMAKYFDGGYSGHLTLVRDGFGFRTECVIHLDSKITLHAEGMAPDAYASADQAAESETEIDGFTPVIIAESTTRLKQLSVSDAVTELDMTGVPVLVFRHAAHGGINIVYRRADGHFGWIDPPAAAAAESH
jgi:ribosomal subunit interface protein